MPVEAAVAAGTMEITVSKFELLRELTATQGVVERKTTIPILSNYLFEAAGERLSLTATDLELGISLTLPSARAESPGGLTAPARILTELLGALPECDVTLSVDGDVKTTCSARLAVPTSDDDNPWARHGQDWRP